MWMLLQPDAPATGPARAAAQAPLETASAPVPFEGAPQGTTQPEVRLYLHPGRSLLETMDLARLCEQFDLDAEHVFERIEQAEAWLAGNSGFLAEIHAPFLDARGERRESGVVFVPGLRG